MSYSLENLWNFTDPETQQILNYFNHPIYNNLNDKLNAVILSFNNNLLNPDDKQYVSLPQFNQLFLATDDQLRSMVFRSDLNHVEMVKLLIDYYNIPIVSQIPTTTESISMYQMNNNIYVCGKGTYPIRDQLKSLNGTWDPKLGCWSFPLTQKISLMEIKYPKSVERIASPEIPVVTSIPKFIPNNLQVYQIRDRIFVCGRETLKIKYKLSQISGADFEDKCWNYPLYKTDEVLELVNRHKAQLADEPNRLKRLTIQEYEQPYISHLSRLPPNHTWDQRNNAFMSDLAELMPLWRNKIQIIGGQGGTIFNKYTLTYTGDIKPPDVALVLAANDWKLPEPGWKIERKDYKKYEVTIDTNY